MGPPSFWPSRPTRMKRGGPSHQAPSAKPLAALGVWPQPPPTYEPHELLAAKTGPKPSQPPCSNCPRRTPWSCRDGGLPTRQPSTIAASSRVATSKSSFTHEMVEVGVLGQFAGRLLHPPDDDLRPVLSAPFDACAQGAAGWRQNEHRHGTGPGRAHLRGALPVDFEDHVAATPHLFQHCLARRAVGVAEDASVFEEFAGVAHGPGNRLTRRSGSRARPRRSGAAVA